MLYISQSVLLKIYLEQRKGQASRDTRNSNQYSNLYFQLYNNISLAIYLLYSLVTYDILYHTVIYKFTKSSGTKARVNTAWHLHVMNINHSLPTLIIQTNGQELLIRILRMRNFWSKFLTACLLCVVNLQYRDWPNVVDGWEILFSMWTTEN